MRDAQNTCPALSRNLRREWDWPPTERGKERQGWVPAGTLWWPWGHSMYYAVGSAECVPCGIAWGFRNSEREKHSLHLPSFKLGSLSLIQIAFSHSLQNCGLKCHKRSHQESHSLSPFFLFPGVTHTPERVCPGPHTRMCPHPKHAPLGCMDSYFRTVLKMIGYPFSISICCNDSQRQINRENQS